MISRTSAGPRICPVSDSQVETINNGCGSLICNGRRISIELSNSQPDVNDDTGSDARVTIGEGERSVVLRSIQSASQADGRVRSTVSFGDTGVLIYTMEKTPAGWRIADVVDRGRAGEGDLGLMRTLTLR